MKRNPFQSIPFMLLAAALAIFPCRARAAAASPSELLEKGIYTEETKGDIDAAITIYQQVVAEVKASQSLAAQAQFRLAQCYLKTNRAAEATAAFAKLIEDYPDEKELVAKAREHVPSGIALEPVPWVDGERLQLVIKLGTSVEVGVVEYRANLAEVDGHKVWRVGARTGAGAPGQSVSSVDVDAETFRPLSSRWKHTLLGDVSAVYGKDEVVLRRVGVPDVTKLPLRDTVYDNEECAHAMRRLPLQVGYKTTLSIMSTLSGAAVPLSLEVVAKEVVEVPAGKFECFKVKLSVGQTFWYSADAHRYLVKFEAGGAVAELTSIAQREAGEAVPFRDEELHISFTAPAEWLNFRFRKGQPAGQSLIRTFDPNADATDGGVRLYATDSLPEASRQSPRAWAEAAIKDMEGMKVRPESWKNYDVGGLPGVGCVVEFKENDQPQVKLLVFVPGPKNSELFVIASSPEKFDALRAEFEGVLASYKR